MTRGKAKNLFLMAFICFFLSAIGPWTTATIAQTTEFQWSKSAKSLTIFQPGDAVRIQVWELFQEGQRNLNLSADYPINPDGNIIMPLIGQVRVKGLTVFELMQTLEEKLKAYLRNPYVSVRPLIRIVLQGAFNRPGSYRADPSSSLWDLIAQAGGPNASANLKNMSAERGGKTVIKKLLKAFEEGHSLEEVGIESGDQIIVPARRGFDLQFIIGLINLLASVVLLYLRLRTGTF